MEHLHCVYVFQVVAYEVKQLILFYRDEHEVGSRQNTCINAILLSVILKHVTCNGCSLAKVVEHIITKAFASLVAEISWSIFHMEIVTDCLWKLYLDADNGDTNSRVIFFFLRGEEN